MTADEQKAQRARNLRKNFQGLHRREILPQAVAQIAFRMKEHNHRSGILVCRTYSA